MDSAPEFVKKMTGPGMVELARRSLENRTPILLIALLGCALCAFGAYRMRSLKLTGFPFYVIGELLPAIAAIFLLGFGSISGFLMIGACLVPLVFIILYATQLKYMA